ncbi:MAG: hypothetical protein EPN91_01615 [Salinibacterium sp.]|nr:MAG: hypothetical protein EPN91_01615 [Salinibacterium sp.]
MTARRLRLLLLLAGLLFASLVLLAWSQPWFELTLDGGQKLEVAGQRAVPALSALGLAGIALVAVLSIAKQVLRVVLGTIQAAIGLLVVTTALTAASAPLVASANLVTQVTGVSGAHSVAALVARLTETPWPFVAVGAGALLALTGIAVALTASRWPAATRKYDATRPRDPWDSLSHGDDPTKA